MRESLKLASFIFIFIGTLGLLANELVFHLGTVAVLTFAALSVIGLVILAGKTLVAGNRAEYRFDPNCPVTKEIIAKAKEFSEQPKVTDTEVQPEPENSKADRGASEIAIRHQASPKPLVTGSNPVAATSNSVVVIPARSNSKSLTKL